MVVEPEIKGNTVDDGVVKDALANAQPEAVNPHTGYPTKVEVKDAVVFALAAKSTADGTGAMKEER